MATTRPAAAVSLSDLSDEDRARLLSELAADERAREAAAAQQRQSRIAQLLEERDHVRDCPQPDRVEAYGDTKPARPDLAIPARPVTVVRCQECGGSVVIDRPYDVVRAELTDPAPIE